MKTSQELALRIVQKLNMAGYTAYFAGGWVRDHVMGRESDDIDIATSASPEKILDLFPRTLVVGLSFGVVIVMMEGHPFEVATFRTDVGYSNGRTPDGILFSSPREDALRRDFTINGMFFDPVEKKIYDYIGGMEDIHKGVIRTIGDPYERFFEDRLRMVRAFRFAARFGFKIDMKTQEAVLANAENLFPSVAMERVFQELSKMAKQPRFDWACIEMHRLGLLSVIFPALNGLHLQELKHRVRSFSNMQENALPILYLAKLFPDFSLEDLKDLAIYLKSGNESQSALELLMQAEALIKKLKNNEEISPLVWVQFLAKDKKEMIFRSALASYEERDEWLNHMAALKKRYSVAIERASKNQTLITGDLLKKEGIKPGKFMGDLIKAGEKIAILQGLEDKEAVLDQLKKNYLWQTP